MGSTLVAPTEGFAQAVGFFELITRLSAREQCVLRLIFEEGLPLSQIGERMGISESRVCQLKYRALSKLRTQLDEAA